MAIVAVRAKRFVRALIAAGGLWVGTSGVAAAQSPTPASSPGSLDNLPGVIILIVPLAIGAALYLSYRLGRGDEESGPRREGAVSRALARRPSSAKES